MCLPATWHKLGVSRPQALVYIMYSRGARVLAEICFDATRILHTWSFPSFLILAGGERCSKESGSRNETRRTVKDGNSYICHNMNPIRTIDCESSCTRDLSCGMSCRLQCAVEIVQKERKFWCKLEADNSPPELDFIKKFQVDVHKSCSCNVEWHSERRTLLVNYQIPVDFMFDILYYSRSHCGTYTNKTTNLSLLIYILKFFHVTATFTTSAAMQSMVVLNTSLDIAHLKLVSIQFCPVALN